MLKHLSVLVTGAAGSLGSATAKALISEGCKVAMFDLPDSKGEELAKTLGEDAVFSPGCVTSDEDIIRTLDLIKNKFGYLRAVVNCAGVHRVTHMTNTEHHESDMKKAEETFRVNVLGTIKVIRLAVSYMRDNPVDKNSCRGVFINTSGFGAFDGYKGQVLMSSAWGALSSMTLPLSRELGDHGFRVMAIAPGLMDSNLTEVLPKKIKISFMNFTPFPKRFGFKEEYANLVISILKNNFLNGEVIRLDGGLRLPI